MIKRIKNLSMLWRMMLVFTVPLILSEILVFQISYPYLLNNYKEKMRYIVEQSYQQAASFVENYVQNMRFLSQIVENNGDVQSILFSGNFNGERPRNEQYYEFYSLNKVFDSVEVSNSMYRFGLYVPDDINYSTNNYHIFPEGRLKERPDYEELMEALTRGQDYLGISEERTFSNRAQGEKMVTMYYAIRNQKDPLGEFRVCSVSVSVERFQEMMRNANITKEGASYLILSDGSETISSNESLTNELQLSGKLPGTGEELAWKPINVGGSRYYVIRQPLTTADWYMISLIPYWEYTAQYALLRLSLNHGKSVICIREEVEHTEVYVRLQNYHYDDAIRIETDVPKELEELACLNIILQPFVENSIVHGIAADSRITSCRIEISVRRELDDLIFCVKDDGPGMTKDQMEDAVSLERRKLEHGYGIKNINFRIKLCFGEKYGVSYKSKVGEGTTAFICIPALTMEEAEKMI